ncbi:MAG: hypothetical protein EBT59_00945 [Betaproteobacteria bacterium]|nr:hypothetical protein [Betaproteobacteria bacterium]
MMRARHVDRKLEQALLDHGLNPVLARVYAARELQTITDIRPGLDDLLRPDKMAGIEQAVDLLFNAIHQQAKLLVVADYDCDGASACAVAIRGLRMMGAKVDYLVPNRSVHGYGLTPEIVLLAMRHPRLGKPDLIITVDNGIASHEGIDAAAASGIPVLVTDHHLPAQSLPAAKAIVNPNQHDCSFPSKHLAGVGVMFYVLIALRRRFREHDASHPAASAALQQLLDLVALGTVADLVKLDRNNRALVDAHEGIVGLLASKLKDQFNRPVLALAPSADGELLRGSGRSIPGLHLRDALDWISKQSPQTLVRFGGHAMAAGFSIRRDSLPDLERLFASAVSAMTDPEQLAAMIWTDGPLDPSWLREDWIQSIHDAIWGQGFPAPLFQDQFEVITQQTLADKHLKLRLQSEQGFKLDGIAFGRREPFSTKIRAAYRLQINRWQGRQSLQCVLEHVEAL